MIEPLLRLDSRERWRPCAVEALYEVGATINGQPLDLDALPAAGGRIDLPRDAEQPDTPVIGYHRVATVGSLWFHQFWLFWLYNPKTYFGAGAHEGQDK